MEFPYFCADTVAGTPQRLIFAEHHHMLTQVRVDLVENAQLDELARHPVWLSCTAMLPPRGSRAPTEPVKR
jgi:hypothetical protein